MLFCLIITIVSNTTHFKSDCNVRVLNKIYTNMKLALTQNLIKIAKHVAWYCTIQWTIPVLVEWRCQANQREPADSK